MPIANIIDELCPSYTGEKRISMQLALDSTSPRAFSAVNIDVDYSAAAPDGIVLPLKLTILAPSPVHFVRTIYRRIAPSQISFRPREGGRHIVRLSEVGHNRWFATLTVNVVGDSLTADGVT